MRIYFISPNPVWGGAATANMAIAEMLAEDNTVLYNDEYNNVTIKNVIYDSFPVHRLKNSKVLFNYILDNQIDFVIWGISTNIPYYTRLIRMLKCHSIKQAVLFHSLSISRDSKGRLIEWLTSKAVKHIDQLVFVSKFTDVSWSKYRTIRNHERHNVIYNPVKALTSISKSNCSRVGFVGRFSAEKQPEVFAKLSELDNSYQYIAWGEGELLDSLRSKYPKVDFKGHSINRDEIYSSFDILVMTSSFENCPMVILEAWQYGIPCVVPRVGGIPEIVTDGYNGIIYNDYSSDSIISCINRIMMDYNQYRNNCYKDVSNYSFQKLYQRWDRVLHDDIYLG